MRYFYLLFLLILFNTLSAQSWEPVGAGVTRFGSDDDPVMALYTYHGKLYIGGRFIYSGNKKVNNLACWNGIKIDTVGKGIDSIVSSFIEYKGELLIGGSFSKKLAFNKWIRNITIWNDTTGMGFPLRGGLENIRDCPIYPQVLAMYNGELSAGGSFSYRVSIQNYHTLLKWDGISWVNLWDKSKTIQFSELGIQFINALAPYNGKLYIGFEDFPSRNGIVSWDGKKVELVGKGLNKGNGTPEYKMMQLWQVKSLAVYKDNLYAGGHFDSAGGKRIYNIAQWNDTDWSTVGTGIKGIISCMEVYNGKLYVGGVFDSAGGKPAMNIAVWDGKSWSAVGEGLEAKRNNYFRGRVTTLAVYKDVLYAGGTFDFSGNTQLSNIAKLNIKGRVIKSSKKK